LKISIKPEVLRNSNIVKNCISDIKKYVEYRLKSDMAEKKYNVKMRRLKKEDIKKRYYYLKKYFLQFCR